MKKKFWSFLEVFETILIAVVAVVLIRTFIAQPFLVSGSSMEPTFESGNYLLVDEMTYNFRNPKRGEVIVFNSPSDNGSYYIKRIIGLPGERVVIDDETVSIYENGEEKDLNEDYITNFDLQGRDYDVTLESDEYFVLGDNRGFSYDSRNWGALEEEKIIGLVRLRLWPINQAVAFERPHYQ